MNLLQKMHVGECIFRYFFIKEGTFFLFQILFFILYFIIVIGRALLLLVFSNNR